MSTVTEPLTTNWNTLLSNQQKRNLIMKWSVGEVSTRFVSQQLAFSEAAGEFRRLVRTHGTTYGRRLARKALNRRGVRVSV